MNIHEVFWGSKVVRPIRKALLHLFTSWRFGMYANIKNPKNSCSEQIHLPLTAVVFNHRSNFLSPTTCYHPTDVHSEKHTLENTTPALWGCFLLFFFLLYSKHGLSEVLLSVFCLLNIPLRQPRQHPRLQLPPSGTPPFFMEPHFHFSSCQLTTSNKTACCPRKTVCFYFFWLHLC